MVLSVSDPLLVLVVVPSLLMLARLAFSGEIRYWLGAWRAYRLRPFDVDRDPKTPDWCQQFNGASGVWETVSLTYSFGLCRGKNGVYVHYYDEDWVRVRVERVPFCAWSERRKARLDPRNLPPGIPLAMAN